MTRDKIRHQLFLDADLSARLEALAAKPGASKSAILADALAAWLNRRGVLELDDRFGISSFYETTRLTQARQHGPGAGRRDAVSPPGSGCHANATGRALER